MKVEQGESFNNLQIRQTQPNDLQQVAQLDNNDLKSKWAEPRVESKNTKTPETDREELETILEQVNQYANFREVNLHLRIDKSTDITVVSVIDKETEEVIRQIPSEQAIKIAKNIQDAIEEFLSPDKKNLNLHFLSDHV